MAKHLQTVRGMRDILPEQSASWQYIEATARQLFNSYGYKELRAPIIESTELFKRSIGDATDIVEKEMYTFGDTESLSLRPEGTAGTVRAGIQHGLFHNQQQRLWYIGPMFRRERPQKGRYRGFYQTGIEAFGAEGPEVDAEIIAIAARFWKQLGLQNVRLEINSLGSNEARQHYRDVLIDYFSQHHEQLDEDSQRRLHKNPLRILDSKNPAMQALVENAPNLLDYLDDDSKQHFEGLKARLEKMGIAYQVNPRLVRGIDYYNRTVFEWITEDLGAQGTICGGGRYDGLVKQLGGRETPACGFGIGIDRLQLLVEEQNLAPQNNQPHAYMVLAGEEAELLGIALSEQLRNAHPALKLTVNVGGGSFKSQLKRADNSGAAYALILGENEVKTNEIVVKALLSSASHAATAEQQQQTLSLDELSDFVEQHIIT